MTGQAVSRGKKEAVYPAVRAAFGFVIPSYQLLMGRFEAADNRLSGLLTFASGITAAVPAFAKAINPNIPFGSTWLKLAVAMFLVSVALVLLGRWSGKLTLPNPKIHFNESLHHDEWTFQKNAIFFAGRHFDMNADAIRLKGNIFGAALAAVSVEIVLLVVWIGSGR